VLAVDLERWRRLTPLLDQLLALDGARCEERLAELRHCDRELADQLGSLLAQQQTIERKGFLAGLALDGVPPGAVALVGRTVGAYTLERRIGAGGMGEVWLARRSDGASMPRSRSSCSTSDCSHARAAGASCAKGRRWRGSSTQTSHACSMPAWPLVASRTSSWNTSMATRSTAGAMSAPSASTRVCA
jgi:hypothetical protein